MIAHNEKTIRKLAVARILKARKSVDAKVKSAFKVPEINFEAQSFCDMISWNTRYINGDITDDSVCCTSYIEPPVLFDLSEDDLLCIAEDGNIKDIIRGLPFLNQRIERTIRLVSQTS